MARELFICGYCKLDNCCDYSYVRCMTDCLMETKICPMFIYDNGEPISNAERISSMLRTGGLKLESAADEMWNETVLNEDATHKTFREWLRDEVGKEISKNAKE